MTKTQILELLPIGPEYPDHRRFDPVTAIMGGVGLVGNVASGLLGKSAANKAGAIQTAAANQAADEVTRTTAAANPQIGDAAHNAGDMALRAADNVTDTEGAAAAGVNTATTSANRILDPYTGAGTDAETQLQEGLKAGGDFNKVPTMADIQVDPGYAFRLQQGELALSRSSAARGGSLGGQAAKDLDTFAQGTASQEYANAFQRYNTTTQSRYDRLFGVSEQGRAAGTTQGNNLTAAARYGGDITTDAAKTNLGANEYAGTIGYNAADKMADNTISTAKTAADYRTGGAAAKAAGVVGGTNALTSGLVGGTNAVTGAITLNQLLKNPARPVGVRV